MTTIKMFSVIVLLLSFTFAKNYGRYFAKKTYIPSPLPTYSKSRPTIPTPILTDNAELLEMYWKSWEIGFTHLRQPQEGSPFVSNYWDEAFSPAIYQWDMIFMTQFTKYIHHIFPSVESLDNFYCRQRKNGFICREIFEKDGKEFFYKGEENAVNPPLFAWSELEWFTLSNDTARLEMVLPALEKYAEYLEEGRKAHKSSHELYWQTGLGSGMDNTPRYGRGWVDISSQMVISYKALATIANIVGKGEKSLYFSQRASAISSKINQYMWSEKSGLYHDLDSAGARTKYETIAGFWPLLAGIPNKKQAAKMVQTLLDTSKFNRRFPFASLSATHDEFEPEGGYWRGGSWPPVSYMAVKGMDLYKYHNISYNQSLKLLKAMYAVYQKSGTIWEFYAADSLSHGKLLHKRTIANKTKEAKADFVGWSALGPVALLIENIIGLHCHAPSQSIEWHIHRNDTHGIKNLYLGKNRVSLLYSENSTTGTYQVSGTATEAFTLTLYKQGVKESFEISSGEFALSGHKEI